MKILVIDDEEGLRRQISKSLKREAHDVTTAENGQQGWDLFTQSPEHFDAIISDIKMPILDGMELLVRLRQHRHQIPVIIMTGHGDLELSVEALRYGAFDFLLKPLDLEVLNQVLLKVKTVLYEKQLPREVPPFVDQLQLTIPSQTRWIEMVCSYLGNHFRPICELRKIDSMRVALCLMEALTNAIIHGNLEVPSSLKEKNWDDFENLVTQREALPEYGERKVRIHYQVQEGYLSFQLTDQGKGFDISKLPDPNEPASLLASGRGILLIRTYMDEVSWNDQGNQITMIKRLV